MQVDPTTRNTAIVLTALSGGALTLLLSRIWAQRSVEVLALGAPLTLVATVVVAHKLEARVQEAATGVPPLQDLPQEERIVALQQLTLWPITEENKERLGAYFDAHGFDELCQLNYASLIYLAEAFGEDLDVAVGMMHALRNGGAEDEARAFSTSCPLNTYLHVCVTCGIEPTDLSGFRDDLARGAADASLLLQLWRNGSGEKRKILNSADMSATTFEAFANACTDDELMEIAKEWRYCNVDNLPFVDRLLAQRQVPLGERSFAQLNHLPHYLHSLPRAQLYNTISENQRTDFVELFAGDKFNDLSVWAILEGKRPMTERPAHVRAYAEVRRVCGLQTSLQELLDYTHTCEVAPPTFTDEELRTLGFARSQEEFDEAVLTWKIKTGNIKVNELTEAQWRDRLSALKPPQNQGLMWRIAREMPNLFFFAYWLMHDEETPRIRGDLQKLPDRPREGHEEVKYLLSGHPNDTKFDDLDCRGWTHQFVEIELREDWQDFLTEYLSQKYYIRRDNIVKFWVQSVIGFLHTPTWLAEQFNQAAKSQGATEPAKRALEIAGHLSEDQRAEFMAQLKQLQPTLLHDEESAETP